VRRYRSVGDGSRPRQSNRVSRPPTPRDDSISNPVSLSLLSHALRRKSSRQRRLTRRTPPYTVRSTLRETTSMKDVSTRQPGGELHLIRIIARLRSRPIERTLTHRTIHVPERKRRRLRTAASRRSRHHASRRRLRRGEEQPVPNRIRQSLRRLTIARRRRRRRRRRKRRFTRRRARRRGHGRAHHVRHDATTMTMFLNQPSREFERPSRRRRARAPIRAPRRVPHAFSRHAIAFSRACRRRRRVTTSQIIIFSLSPFRSPLTTSKSTRRRAPPFRRIHIGRTTPVKTSAPSNASVNAKRPVRRARMARTHA